MEARPMHQGSVSLLEQLGYLDLFMRKAPRLADPDYKRGWRRALNLTIGHRPPGKFFLPMKKLLRKRSSVLRQLGPLQTIN